jgi:hypothetical protein
VPEVRTWRTHREDNQMKNPMGRARSRRMSLAGMAIAVAAAGCLGTVTTGAASAAPAGIVRAAAEPTYFAPLVSADTTWRYLATGVDPSPGADRHAWAQPGFDDSAWSTGKGGFGAKWDGGVESPAYDSGCGRPPCCRCGPPAATTSPPTSSAPPSR